MQGIRVGGKSKKINPILYVIFTVLIVALSAMAWKFGAAGYDRWIGGKSKFLPSSTQLPSQIQTTVNLENVPQSEIDNCQSTTVPTLSFTCADIDNKGTSVGCGVYYRENDGVITYDVDGSFDVSVGSKIEYMVNATGWYNVHDVIEKIPCQETIPINIYMKDYATSPTIQFFQEDDGLLVSSTATEAIVAGDTPAIKTVIRGDNEDYFQDALYWCEVDKTYVDDITFSGYEKSGVVPAYASFKLSQSDKKIGAWSLGDIGKDNIVITEYTTVDSDDTNSMGPNFNMTCYIEDQDWFVNEDAGVFEYGSSDEDDANVGQGNATAVLYTSAT